jgi:hypothetical protein
MSTNRQWISRGLIVTVALLAGACEPAPPAANRRAPESSISHPRTWKITSQGGGIRNLAAAIDGDPLTAAVTTQRYDGASVTIDLGRVCLFNMVTILHGQQPQGHARIVSLYTSNDGQQFDKRYETPGTRSVTSVPVLTLIRARYIRLVAEQAGSRPWSLADIYLQ